MTKLLSPVDKITFFDTDGVPLSGGRVYTWAGGTSYTTPLATFQDRAGLTANTNPIVLDAKGEATIYLTAGLVYDFQVKRANESLVRTRDGIVADNDPTLRADLLSTSPGSGVALIGWPANAGANQAQTGFHFAQNGAGINRWGGRGMFGGAVANDGAFPNVVKDWFSTLQTTWGISTGTLASSVVSSLTGVDPNSAVPFMSATQSLHFTSAGTSALGFASFAVNNNGSLATKAWGGYIEAHRTSASAGETLGLEIDTRTTKATLQPTPRQQGDVVALQLASGAELSATGQHDASVAIQVAANPMRFKVGMNVMYDALVDIGGGVTEVLNMSRYGLLSWFDSTGARSGFLTSSATSAAGGTALDLAQNQVNLSSISGALNFAFVTSSTATNYLSFYSSATTQPVRILAGGTDTNIDLSLEPKGTGLVKFGTFTGSGDVTCNGYVTIKTADGTTRKIMTTA